MSLYLNPLDWAVNQQVQGQPVLVRYADDFVILSRPGQGAELRARLTRWLKAQGLMLNEQKTRLVNFRTESFAFLGFRINRRQGRSGRFYVHVEPDARSRQGLREHINQELNHWTLWRNVKEAIERVNQIARGWAGYFEYGHSARVLGKMDWWMRDRVRRWLWRKQACRRALWTDYPDEKLYKIYGLWRMWKPVVRA